MFQRKEKEMMVNEILEKVTFDKVLEGMLASIKDADLTKDYEVYSTKEFIVDYTENTGDVLDVLDILIATKGDERLLSKIANAAISAIEQRVELESKIDTNLIAAAAKTIHASAVSTGVETKWTLAIRRKEGYWSVVITVASDTDAGEEPVVAFTWCLGKEKKGN